MSPTGYAQRVLRALLTMRAPLALSAASLIVLSAASARADDAPAPPPGDTAPQPPAPAKLDIPEPSSLPRRAVTEQGESPRYHRQDPATGWAVFRPLIGMAFRGAPIDVPAFSFAFDVIAGARLGFTRGEIGWAFVPEVGYSMLSPGSDAPAHLAQMGVGLGAQHEGTSVGLVPRFVIGSANGESAMGGRAAFYADITPSVGVALELSYEALRVSSANAAEGAVIAHAVRLSIGLDMLLPFTRNGCRAILYGSSRRGCD